MSQLIVSGIVASEKKPVKFLHEYQMSIQKTWKGETSLKTISFNMEHHTCAKYTEQFAGEVVSYFVKNKDHWQLVRLVPSSDGFDLKNEIQFISNFKK